MLCNFGTSGVFAVCICCLVFVPQHTAYAPTVNGDYFVHAYFHGFHIKEIFPKL